MKVAVILALLTISANALYSANSPVVQLTEKNFKDLVIKSDEPWLIEFFAPWCGHCKQLAPAYEKAAKALKGIVKVGAVDMTTDQSVGGPYGIQGFPTLKFFGINKGKPTDYNGARTADALVSFSMKEATALAESRLGKKKSSSSSSGSGSGSGNTAGNANDVVVLTDDNFNDNVFSGKEMWLVEFYAPWCGHCKKLQPEWDAAATKLKSTAGVRLAKVDATENNALASRYGVKGYPTIKLFPASTDKNISAIDYNAGRDTESIVQYVYNQLEKHGAPLKIDQLLDQATLESNCLDKSKKNSICVLALLPHIYDSSAKERTGYLETLKKVYKKQRGKPLTFFWLQGSDNYKFEEKLGLTFGYPAVVAISASKGKYAIMRAAFNEKGVNTFLEGLVIGKERLADLPADLPKLVKSVAWDGKDAAAPQVEDEYDDEEDDEEVNKDDLQNYGVASPAGVNEMNR